MIRKEDLKNISIEGLKKKYPFIDSFLEQNQLNVAGYEEDTFIEYMNHFTEEEKEEWAIDIEKLETDFIAYIHQMLEFMGIQEEDRVESLTIMSGYDKFNQPEDFEKITIRKSEIVSIVGPTGSGKSRLLADIEWTAHEDTPTKRTILINDKVPDKKWRFSSSNQLVAQLSQNMNFVMDLSVREFLELHAKSRMVENEEKAILKIIDAANDLCGEQFDLKTPITSLSGGQSRALMIADTAILSTSPIVLIDEIENAGIDKSKALDLLVSEEKIVFMATHDPSLSLMADKRIVIQNGGIHKIIKVEDEEKKVLHELEKINKKIHDMRTRLRKGELLKIESLKGE